MLDNSNDFSNLLQGEDKPMQIFRMATITGTDSGVNLKFNGEEEARGKTYKRLSSYTPEVNDTVIVAKINNSYVILGKVM